MTLSETAVNILPTLTWTQKYAFLRMCQAINVGNEENAELWNLIEPRLKGVAEVFEEPPTVECMREALDSLPIDSSNGLQILIGALARGNVYDEVWTENSDGTVSYKPSPRYREFVSYVIKEARYLGLNNPSVLDVGCWQGTMMYLLRLNGYRVSGIDLCGPALKTARHRLSRFRDGVELYEGMASEVLSRIPPKTFDIVICAETLEHVPSVLLGETCREISRVVKNLILVEVPGWDDGAPNHLRVFTLEDICKLFPADMWRMQTLQNPGMSVYTTVKLTRRKETL